MSRPTRYSCSAILGLIAVIAWGISAADEAALVLLVQPLPREERAVTSYQPLAQYIETLTGRHCVIQAPSNFHAYWDLLRRNNYDIAFDGPHFTDYRTNKFGFNVLAKIPDNVSYSLVMRQVDRVYDPAQLVGRRIAALGLLSTGTARLSAMFPNPVRQPVLIDVQSADEGLDLLVEKRVEAVFLPTAAIGKRVSRGGYAVILTTEPIAQLVLSTSPRLKPELKIKIRDGLLQAHESTEGKLMLLGIGLDRFEPATAETVANQRVVLKSYWGY